MINVSVRGLKLQMVRFGASERKNLKTKMKMGFMLLVILEPTLMFTSH